MWNLSHNYVEKWIRIELTCKRYAWVKTFDVGPVESINEARYDKHKPYADVDREHSIVNIKGGARLHSTETPEEIMAKVCDVSIVKAGAMKIIERITRGKDDGSEA